MCDGVNDGYCISDECLCEYLIDSSSCEGLFEPRFTETPNLKFYPFSLKIHVSSPPFATYNTLPLHKCETKAGEINAVRCEGIPKYRDYSDEYFCENSPSFCSDSCHLLFLMGDRYCDGVEDTAWRIH